MKKLGNPNIYVFINIFNIYELTLSKYGLSKVLVLDKIVTECLLPRGIFWQENIPA